MPYLRECDLLTGAVIGAAKTTAVYYERDHPGELVHVDVKKIGKIPDGGGLMPTTASRAPPAPASGHGSVTTPSISIVDDHFRLAYPEILGDEKGSSCAAFVRHAAEYFVTSISGVPPEWFWPTTGSPHSGDRLTAVLNTATTPARSVDPARRDRGVPRPCCS